MTIKGVREELRQLGIVIRKTEYGEYRVNLRGAGEAAAYYTTDLGDALDTGRAMARRIVAAMGPEDRSV